MSLAVLGGTGRLPALVAEAATARGEPVVLCEMAGFEAPGAEGVERLGYRIETVGTMLDRLAERGVTEVVLAGAIRRPAIDPAAIDAATRPLVPRLAAAIAAGDDGALRAVIAILEERGLTVRAAQDVRPDLLPAAGVPTRAVPPETAGAEADRAAAVVAALGAADIGQGCIVRDGQALAVEGALGTDWLLDALATGRPAAGALLYKGPKPGQDRRADWPAIGPETAARAARAGLAGIVVPEGGVMVIDLAATVAACDEAGLFLWIR